MGQGSGRRERVAGLFRRGRRASRIEAWMADYGDRHSGRGRRFAWAKFIRDRYRPAALIIGEPSGWDRVTLGYKGSAWFESTVRRTLVHTSAQVESACEAAVGFWNRVTSHAAEFNTGKSKMFEQFCSGQGSGCLPHFVLRDLVLERQQVAQFIHSVE